MNYIKHLTGFFDRIVLDRNLNPTHISLYIALFQFWNVNRFKNPISITRDEVMRISKICSKATYHKCMRELNDRGYIKYEPSFNPFKGSMVILFNFSEDLKPVQKRASSTEKILPNTEQVLYKQRTSDETSTEQALVSSINYINKTNNLNISNLGEQSQNFENNDEFLKIADTEKEKKLREKKKSFSDSLTPIENNHKTGSKKEMPEELFPENQKSSSPAFADYNAEHTEIRRQKSSAKKEKFVTSSGAEKPTSEEIKTYFQQQNFPELEAQKFFNYFSSNGWLVGGKTPMVDWQAAAQNWMLNASKFNTNENQNRAKHLSTPTDKNYAEPL